MRVVGLTGSIATGKSTVSRGLAESGFHVLDADLIAQHVVDKGRWAYRRVVKAFGEAILQDNGQIDRERLGELAFHDRAARRRLNGATHPAVALELARELLLAWLRFESLVVVDMPLLVESGFYLLCWPVVVVSCDEHAQLMRLIQRDGCSEAQAKAKVAAQMPLSAKLAWAQLVLDNSDTPHHLAMRVAELRWQLRDGSRWQALLTSPLTLGLGQTFAVLIGLCRHALSGGWRTKH